MLQLVHVDVGDGTSDREFALGSHTGDHQLVDDVLGILLQFDVDDVLVAFQQHFLGFEADVGEYQGLVLLRLDFIMAVDVANHTKAVDVFDDNTHADKGLARLIGDCAGDFQIVLCPCNRSAEHHQ